MDGRGLSSSVEEFLNGLKLTTEEEFDGYDVEFVGEVDEDFKCSVCLEVMKDPYQIAPCGHCFCCMCLKKLLSKFKENPTCPVDRTAINVAKIFPDNFCKRKIMALKVECKHSSLGCEWKSELSQYERHLSVACLYEDDCCGNEGCNEQFLRKYKEEHENKHCHWRILKCNLCYETVRVFELMEHNQNDCPNALFCCPNNKCEEIMPRNMIQHHTDNDCPFTLQRCPLHSLGCIQQGSRRTIDMHMQEFAKHHIELLCNEVKVLNEKVAACMMASQEVIYKRLNNSSASDQPRNQSKESLLFIWPLKGFSSIPSFQELRSPVYSTGCHGYCFSMALLRRKTDTVVSIRLVPGSFDHVLPWPFRRRFCLHIIDHIKADNRQHISREFNFDTDERVPHCFVKPDCYVASSTLYPLLVVLNEKLDEDRYSSDDTLTLAIKIAYFNADDTLCLPEL